MKPLARDRQFSSVGVLPLTVAAFLLGGPACNAVLGIEKAYESDSGDDTSGSGGSETADSGSSGGATGGGSPGSDYCLPLNYPIEGCDPVDICEGTEGDCFYRVNEGDKVPYDCASQDYGIATLIEYCSSLGG
jgi:hypothetical protein